MFGVLPHNLFCNKTTKIETGNRNDIFISLIHNASFSYFNLKEYTDLIIIIKLFCNKDLVVLLLSRRIVFQVLFFSNFYDFNIDIDLVTRAILCANGCYTRLSQRNITYYFILYYLHINNILELLEFFIF